MSFLNRRTLVLNKTWTPVQITDVKNALVLLVKGSAQVISTETFQVYDFIDWLKIQPNGSGYVQTVRYKISVPEVILLSNYDRVPLLNPLFSKKNVLKRDKYTCQYCGFQTHDLTLDHVIPKSQGGITCWENIVAACGPCNYKKANRTPREAGMLLKHLPERPKVDVKAILQNPEINPSWQKFIHLRSPSN